MKVTIKDVAKKANVAPSTVSRVIADHPKITQETKDKVRKVMKELGYHPNLLARKLVTQTSKTIGVIRKMASHDMVTDPFFPKATQGIGDYLRSENYSTLSVNAVSEEILYQEVVQMVQGKSVDGIILLYSQQNDPILKFLIENKIPFTMLGKPTEYQDEFMYVDNDNIKAMYDMTKYLISLGHEYIAYVGGDPIFEVNKDREQGYQHALEESKIAMNYLYRTTTSIAAAREIVGKLIDANPKPTAVVTTDELSAMSLLSALYEKKLRVPDDMSVVAMNNSLLSELSSPPLTTMDINPYQLGYETAKSLINYLKNPAMMKYNILVPASIVERESCKKI